MQDSYELNLDNKLKDLKQCQDSKNLDSCMECEKVFVCEIRSLYVDSVYNSMNKGAGGFFDFDGAEQ